MAGPHRSILLTLGAVGCAAAFHDLAKRYGGFRMWEGPPAGFEPHPIELAFDVWYLFLGGAFVILLGLAAAARAEDVGQAEGRLRRLGSWPALVPATGLFVLVASLAVKDLVLAGAPISDDESVYDFIAKTIALGRLKNPVPALDSTSIQLLQTNFVVLDGHGWYGKYPIGHPLLLALGEIVGARFVVCPLLAAATAMLAVASARRLLGDAGAAITALLVATSPQLVFTAATDLSQNTTALALTLAVYALIRSADADGHYRTRWLLAVGAALGFGFLARPMPGAAFIVAGTAWLCFSAAASRAERPWGVRLREVAIVALPVALFVALFGFVNLVQSGSPFVSGYETVHGASAYSPSTKEGVFSASVAAALLRQSFWAFGWPCSLLFLPFARSRTPSRGLALLWAMVAAGYVYRLAAPKVFVGTTGPVYVAELVPMLAILTAAGMLRLRETLGAIRPDLARYPAAFAMTSAVAAVAMFLPFQVEWLEQVGLPQRFAADALTARKVKQALVFSMNVTRPDGTTWAMWTPPPPPTLDEPVVYVRRAHGPNGPRIMYDFWRRQFPDRRAFILDETRGPLQLRELTPDQPPPPVEDKPRAGGAATPPG